MKAFNISWDIDKGDCVELPNEIEIPDRICEDEIANYLSDQTGFCHKGFELED